MISAHLPKPARTGRPRADDRRVANAILYVCVTGTRWIDLPARYGSKSTAHKRLQDWQADGTWTRILRAAILAAHRQGRLRPDAVSAGSSTVAAKKGATAWDTAGSGASRARGCTPQCTRPDYRWPCLRGLQTVTSRRGQSAPSGTPVMRLDAPHRGCATSTRTGGMAQT